MTSWTNFCKQFADENGISYKEALAQAGPYYRKEKKQYGAKSYRKRPLKKMTQQEQDMYHAGVLIGGAMGGAKGTPKGALAALLSGLNANIKVE